MKGIICYSDGKFGPLKNKKIKNGDEIKFIFLELHSTLYGTAYMKISKEMFMKIRGIRDIKLRYRFMDGSMLDFDDGTDGEASCWTSHCYYYKDIGELFSKIQEIIISEDVLNDSFWIHDCYYCYCFDDFRIRYRKNNEQYKYSSIDSFYKHIKYSGKEIPYTEFITFGKKKYLETDNESEFKDRVFVKYAQDLYFEVKKKFYTKVKHVDITTKLDVYEWNFDENMILQIDDFDNNNTKSHKVGSYSHIFTEHKFDYEYPSRVPMGRDNEKAIFQPKKIYELFKSRFGPDVIDQLESSNMDYHYKLTSKIKKMNGKKVRPKIHIVDFVYKWFPGTPPREVIYEME